MDFEAVFKLLLEKFQKNEINFAIIGGFALVSAGYTRATQDIDFLVIKEDMIKVKQIMLSYGYKLLYESEDVSNFLGEKVELGRIDCLHAYRKYSKAMLDRSIEENILNGKFKVKIIRPEDLIGLKVQSSSNDPKRYYQDMADIEAIIKANYKKLNMTLINEYFVLFSRESELKEILEKLDDIEQ